MGYARKAVQRTILVFAVSILAAFFGYLIRMVLARNMTPAEYGLFFAVFTLLSFFAVFRDLGLSSALIKYIPEFQVKKKPELIKNSIMLVTGFNLVSAVIIVLILLLSSKYLAVHYFKNPLAVPILRLFTILFFVSIFRDILKTIFNAFQRMLFFSLMYFIENLLILIFILIFFMFGHTIFYPILAYIIAYIFVFLLFIFFFLRSYPFLKYKFSFSSDLIKKLLMFGIPVALASFGGIIVMYTDTLIMTYFRTLNEVGIYNVVIPTAMLLNFFSTAVSQVIFPMVSELWAKGFKAHISQGALLMQKYSFVVIIPIALVMFSFPEILLRLFFGEAYVSGAPALQLLVIGLIFFVIAGINMTILAGIGKPQISTKILLAGALFNFITNFYFIPKYGIIGAATTSLISYFLITILSIFYLKKFIELRLPWSNWVKTLFSSLIFILSIYSLKNLLAINVYLEAIISAVAAGLIYLGLILLLKIIDIREIKDLLFKKI